MPGSFSAGSHCRSYCPGFSTGCNRLGQPDAAVLVGIERAPRLEARRHLRLLDRPATSLKLYLPLFVARRLLARPDVAERGHLGRLLRDHELGPGLGRLLFQPLAATMAAISS